MTDQDKELRRLADAATQGEWAISVVGDVERPVISVDGLSLLTVVYEDGIGFGTVYDPSDAAFIAAANPSVILSLLDRLEAAETAFAQSEKTCRDLTEKVIPNIRRELEAAEREAARSIALFLDNEH